jgi:hypothetical protein
MIREELRRLITWTERHRRLVSRLALVLVLTAIVDLAAGIIVQQYESGIRGSDIHNFGDALFFTSTQLLTISSSLRNPITSVGKVLDVGLEVWGLLVGTSVAGAFAAFFLSGDSAA